MIDKNSDQDEINHDSISTKGIEQTKNDENTKSKFKQKYQLTVQKLKK